MQFCWLQPEQRPTVEEVHLLLSYLCVKGASELEEEFEKRWNSMKPSAGAGSGGHHEAELSSYPLLEHFSSDGFHSDGDDVLTVTETSQGLNFEYKWERGRHDQYPLSPGCQPYQDMYYTPSMGDRLSLGVSPSCYENKEGIPGSRSLEVVPVLSAHSPSVTGDYYIRIEEPLSCSAGQDYSSQYGGNCEREKNAPQRGNLCDSDVSPSISLSMEPLLGQTPITNTCSAGGDRSLPCEVRSRYYELSRGEGAEEQLLGDHLEEDNFGESGFIDPLGASPSLKELCQVRLSTAKLAFLERAESEEKRKQTCGEHTDTVTLKAEDGNSQYGDLSAATSHLTAFSPHWASNISSNNNISSAPPDQGSASWCNRRSGVSQKVELEPYGPESWQVMESGEGDTGSFLEDGEREQISDAERLKVCCGDGWSESSSSQISPPSAEVTNRIQGKSDALNSHPTDLLLHPLASPSNMAKSLDQEMDPLGVCLSSHFDVLLEPKTKEHEHTLDFYKEVVSDVVLEELCSHIVSDTHSSQDLSPNEESTEKTLPTDLYQMPSDSDDEDTMEVTSGVFTDLSSEQADTAPSFRSLQKQVGTPDSLDSLDMPSTASSCDAFSLGTYGPCGQHKALDSGYDTENYESPEFVLKEPQENRDPESYYQLSQASENGQVPGEMSMSRSVSSELQSLNAKNPYRDSAYFSDYDSFTREEEEEGGQEEEHEQEDSPRDTAAVDIELGTLNSHFEEKFDESKSEQGQFSAAQENQGSQELSPILSSPVPKELVSLQLPLIAREDSVDEGLGLDCNKASSIDKLSSLPSVVESTSHRTFLLSPVQICLTKSCSTKHGASGSITLTTGLQVEDKVASCHRDVPGATHLPKCLSPPIPRKEVRVGESPEEEDEDEESEDSDESDEELRCYNIQEQSEESEEEHGAVPIVITDHGSSGHLRSLLKMHSFRPETICTELDRKKKAVSFYDDVTVYLFDQESPTRELAEPDFPEIHPSNGPSIIVQESEQNASKEPVEQRLLGESGGYEWEEDFPLSPLKSSFVTSLSPALLSSDVHSLSAPVPIQKATLPVQFSRFSVSPTSLSRFSITQVADSEMQSVGGSRKAGEQV